MTEALALILFQDVNGVEFSFVVGIIGAFRTSIDEANEAATICIRDVVEYFAVWITQTLGPDFFAFLVREISQVFCWHDSGVGCAPSIYMYFCDACGVFDTGLPDDQ